MPTKLLYFEDTYKFTGSAKIEQILDKIEIESIKDEVLSKALSKAAFSVILDQTLFYPQGGGQPTDIGQITKRNDAGDIDVEFRVAHVLMHKQKVYHMGEFVKGDTFAVGERVDLSIDPDTRRANAKCHSAGHVIFSIMKENPSKWNNMVENKGHHFSDGAYVEFKGVLPDSVDKDSFQRMIDDVVAENLPVIAYTDGRDGLRYIRVGQFVQNACGGTHVRNTSELGKILIKKINRRKAHNITKISYSVIQVAAAA